MRKIFAVAAIAATLVAADDAAAQSFQFGPGAGVSIANVTGDDAGETDSRTGFFGGAQVIWQAPGSLFGFETGAMYVQKGAKIAEADATIELDYIAVPLMLRVAPPMGSSSFTPVFGLGGEAAFEVGCSVTGEAEGVDVDVDCEEFDEAGLQTKSFDFGLAASVGLDFPVGRMTLAPFAKYTYGLTSIDDSEAEGDVKNSGFLVGAALRF